jgi:hypothetical protein
MVPPINSSLILKINVLRTTSPEGSDKYDKEGTKNGNTSSIS